MMKMKTAFGSIAIVLAAAACAKLPGEYLGGGYWRDRL